MRLCFILATFLLFFCNNIHFGTANALGRAQVLLLGRLLGNLLNAHIGKCQGNRKRNAEENAGENAVRNTQHKNCGINGEKQPCHYHRILCHHI